MTDDLMMKLAKKLRIPIVKDIYDRTEASAYPKITETINGWFLFLPHKKDISLFGDVLRFDFLTDNPDLPALIRFVFLDGPLAGIEFESEFSDLPH